MEFPKPSWNWNPLLSFSSFIQQYSHRLGAELNNRLEDTRRLAGSLAGILPPPCGRRSGTSLPLPLFASLTHLKPALAASLSSDHVAKSLTGTSVYTVSNSNNEFVLISDPNGTKSIGLLCFRHEDAEAYLAQVCFFVLLTFNFNLREMFRISDTETGISLRYPSSFIILFWLS